MRFLFILALLLQFYPSTAQNDDKAIALADAVIEAIGGEENWANTHFVRWNFFGGRLWYWDKWTGDVRCEIPSKDLRIAMNIHDMEGKVFSYGKLQTTSDSIEQYLDAGYQMWINDSYWLVMPFKLRDPGVTLKYLGTKEEMNGSDCAVLEMTFEDVGVTPDNKYWVYIDESSNLIVQWDFFRNYNDSDPMFQSPWTDYKEFDGILLSSGRGQRAMEDIAVYSELPSALFRDVTRSAEEIMK